MSNFKILVVAASDDLWVTQDALSVLESVGAVTRLDLNATADQSERRQRFHAAISDVDAIVSAPWGTAGIPPLTPETFASATRLKVIAGTYDNRFDGWLDVQDANARGITVIDTSRSMTPTVAEFALAMILNLLRNIPHELQQVRAGRWIDGWFDTKGFVAGDLTGKRVGLAGYGSINRRLREFLVPFRCDVAVFDPFVSDDTLGRDDARRASSLVELARGCDIFVVGIPPMPTTLGIISRAVIDAIPRGGLFVLVTRMAVVEQEALWRRTQAGEIRAAVDVYASEPPPIDSPIRTDPNVLPTPHLAGNTAYCHRRCFRTACEDAAAALAGRPLRYEATVRDALMYAGKWESARA